MWKSSNSQVVSALSIILSTINAGQLTKRGFLTLRDSLVNIYASITFASFCFTSERARESSRFYTFDKVPKVCRVITPLTAYCPKKGLSVGLTGRHATASFTDRLIGYALTFLFAKYVCIRLSKHGGCILNEFSLTSNEHTAIFYVMPDFPTLAVVMLANAQITTCVGE